MMNRMNRVHGNGRCEGVGNGLGIGRRDREDEGCPVGETRVRGEVEAWE